MIRVQRRRPEASSIIIHSIVTYCMNPNKTPSSYDDVLQYTVNGSVDVIIILSNIYLNEIWVFTLYFNFIIIIYNFSELLLGRSRENSKDEHMHQSDAVLESVMAFRLGAGAVAEVVIPLCLAKAV